MKINPFVGVGTAMITPLEKGGEIDWNALGKLVERQIGAGVDFLVPCGTTGESPTLTHSEHEEVIRFAVKVVAGRVPVLAGTGSNSLAEALALTQAAKDAGADGVLVVSPYYNKPTQKGIKEYYRKLAEIGLPIVLYDIPGRCGGGGVSAQTIIELAREDTIQGLKWASGNLDQLQEVLASLGSRREDFTVLSGDDNLTFLAICLGADGVISVLSNLAPEAVVSFVSELRQGNWAVGRQEHYRLLRLMKAMFIETNPIPVKTAMAIAYPDIYQEILRSPMCTMEEENKAKLKEVLRAYGLIS